jgi:hypothetical protein
MAELLIKKGDNKQGDPKSYLHGHIISVAEEGTYKDMPWCYTIVILGTSKESLSKYVEEVKEEYVKEEYIRPDIYKRESRQQGVYAVNDREYSEYCLGKFIEPPSIVRTEVIKGKTYHLLRGKALRLKERRRFRISPQLFNQLFSGRTTRVTMTLNEFQNLIKTNIVEDRVKLYGN